MVGSRSISIRILCGVQQRDDYYYSLLTKKKRAYQKFGAFSAGYDLFTVGSHAELARDDSTASEKWLSIWFLPRFGSDSTRVACSGRLSDGSECMKILRLKNGDGRLYNVTSRRHDAHRRRLVLHDKRATRFCIQEHKDAPNEWRLAYETCGLTPKSIVYTHRIVF